MATDEIEFYCPAGLLVRVNSSMVPAIDSKISIRGEAWVVRSVSYCVDHSDDPALKRIRANVDMVRASKGKQR